MSDEEIFWTQLEQLFKPLNPKRVSTKQGMSYLEYWDVTAHLSRIFGPLNWSKQVVKTELVFETENDNKWTVCYRATVRLEVKYRDGHYVGGYAHKTSDDVGSGTAVNQPQRGEAHDLALKTAVSDALKRCAKDLGNQFGLSLYDKGSTFPVVDSSLAHPNPFEEA